MYYFAYGSNLDKRQMRERCPDSKPKFAAHLPNYRLIFVGWSRQWRGGVASIRPFRGERVLGAVYEVSDKDLRRRFERFGKVASARVIENKFNGKSKGFGFVEMSERQEAEAAIKALNGKAMRGRKLVVNEAKTRSRDD